MCAHLLSCGDEVVGIDVLTDYYDPTLKERNLTPLRNFNAFSFHRVDLLDAPLSLLLEGAEVIYHLAGQPGVRSSWGRDFPQYVTRNVLATHALLEAAPGRPIRKMDVASSSSIYGKVQTYPIVETLRPQPLRHTGDEAAAEHVCELYRTASKTHRLAAPVQRVRPATTSDMAFSRLLAAVTQDRPFSLYATASRPVTLPTSQTW